jgi:hypothetical protein
MLQNLLNFFLAKLAKASLARMPKNAMKITSVNFFSGGPEVAAEGRVQTSGAARTGSADLYHRIVFVSSFHERK